MAAASPKQITVQRDPTAETLQKLGVKRWPTWGCGVSKFDWTYDSTETSYVIEGEVVVTPTGGSPVEIRAGDLVTFPEGMSCVWDVKKAIKKHYSFS